MSEELNNIELIEQYAESSLSAQDRAAFEARLLIDEELKDELELYQKIYAGLTPDSSAELRKKLNAIDRELDAEDSKIIFIKNNNIKKYFPVAAIILLFLISAFYLFFFRTAEEKLIIQYDEKDVGLPVLMSPDANEDLSNAMSYYKLGELDSSIAIINDLLAKNPDNDTLNFYAAIISEQLKKYDDAIKIYLIVLSDKSSSFNSKASYHLGITYLKTKNTSDARNIFSSIASDPNNPFKKKASEILEKIAFQ